MKSLKIISLSMAIIAITVITTYTTRKNHIIQTGEQLQNREGYMQNEYEHYPAWVETNADFFMNSNNAPHLVHIDINFDDIKPVFVLFEEAFISGISDGQTVELHIQRYIADLSINDVIKDFDNMYLAFINCNAGKQREKDMVANLYLQIMDVVRKQNESQSAIMDKKLEIDLVRALDYEPEPDQFHIIEQLYGMVAWDLADQIIKQLYGMAAEDLAKLINSIFTDDYIKVLELMTSCSECYFNRFTLANSDRINDYFEIEDTDAGNTYVIKAGDSLWKIAKKYYGNGADYILIYDANINVIGSNKNLIYPGQVLVIPDPPPFIEGIELMSPDIEAGVYHIITFGGIEWRVLDIVDGKALIISDENLESRYYHYSGGAITWADSDIRAYLNGEFYKSFDVEDRARIARVTNSNPNNPWFGTWGGKDTQDYIFLLSIDEVVKYFGDSGKLGKPRSNELEFFDQYNKNRSTGTLDWWLRSPGSNSSRAADVLEDGSVYVDGRHLNIGGYGGVRPALWLRFTEAEISELSDSEKLYQVMLDNYYTGINEKWDNIKTESVGIDLGWRLGLGNLNLHDYGYAFIDINGDGIDELIIGRSAGTEILVSGINVWTIVDWEYRLFLGGGAMYRYSLYENNVVRIDARSGDGYYISYNTFDSEFSLSTLDSFFYIYDKNEEGYNFIHVSPTSMVEYTDRNGNNYIISDKEADDIREQYSFKLIELTPFFDWEVLAVRGDIYPDAPSITGKGQAQSALTRPTGFVVPDIEAGEYYIVEFGGIEWRVLDIVDGKALIISDTNLGSYYYHHTSNDNTTWADSDIREYLNGTFYDSFSVEDRVRITTVTNSNPCNPLYGTSGGIETQDKIFLLSIDEVEKYFGDSGMIWNRNPIENIYQYNINRRTIDENWWWLRSPGSYNSNAAFVYQDGSVVWNGRFLWISAGVRPALWLDIQCETNANTNRD